MLQKCVLPIVILIFLASACHRINNRLDRIALECGTESKRLVMGQRHFQLRFQGKPLSYQEVGELRLNDRSLKDQLTPKACFNLPTDVDGELVVVHKDRIHAKVLAKIPLRETDQLQGIDLDAFTPVSENLSLQKKFSDSFCPSSTGSMYLKTPEYSFSFDSTGYTKPAGFLVHAVIPDPDSRLFLSKVNLEIQDRKQIFLDLLRDPFRSDKKALSLQLEVTDYLGSKFVTQPCKFIVDPNLPALVSINQTTFFQGIYVEVDGKRNLEFTMRSSIPLQEVRLAYHAMDGANSVKQEVYVPFQTDENNWSMLTPLPELSGDNRVIVEVENKAGQVTRSEFIVDFGVRRYIQGGIRLLSQSRNEKYMVIINQKDEITVLDDNLFPMTKQLPGMKGIIGAEVSDDGSFIVMLFQDHVRIFNLLKNLEIRIEGPFSFFKILNSANKMLAVTGSSKLVWYDLQTGSKERELPIADEAIRYLELSPSDEMAIVATDKRNIYKVTLKPSPDTELIDNCTIGTINVIDIARDSKSFAYNCNEVVFHHRLEKEPRKLEVFRFKSGSGVRSLGFGLKDMAILAGSDLGDWYIINVETLETYPNNRVEGLEKDYFFKSSADYISISTDSTMAFISTMNGEAKLLSLQNRQMLKSFDDERQIVGIGFISDKNQAFIGSTAESLVFFRAKDKSESRFIGQKIKHLSISNSGRVAAATIFDEQVQLSSAAAIVLDGTTMDEVGRVRHDRTVNFANLSLDGSWLLSGSDDKSAKITDLRQGNELNFISKFNPGLRSIRKVTFDRKNDKILATFSRQIFVFQSQNLDTPLYSITANDWIPSTGFAGGDRYVISGSADKTAKIHNAETGTLLAEVTTQGVVWSVDLSDDGKFFAVLSADNKLRIFQSVLGASGEIQGLEEYFALDLPTTGEFMSFSPDSRYLALSLWSGESLLISLEPKRRFKLYCSKTGFASPPVFSSDSQYLAVGQNNDAFIYRVADGKPVQHVKHEDRITSLVFDKVQIWSGSWDGSLKKTRLETVGKAPCR